MGCKPGSPTAAYAEWLAFFTLQRLCLFFIAGNEGSAKLHFSSGAKAFLQQHLLMLHVLNLNWHTSALCDCFRPRTPLTPVDHYFL